MAFGSKSAEEREEAARRKTAQREMAETAKALADTARAKADAEKQAASQEAAFRKTPVGLATTAKERDEGFFEIQLTVGSSRRDSTVWGTNTTSLGRNKTRTYTGLLSEIEAVGWRLEHVGYVFIVTAESSRDKFLASGQQTAVSGETVGIYLFRNADPAG